MASLNPPLKPMLAPADIFPLALNVVNAPVLAVVAPMAVEFRPVEVKVARAVSAVEIITFPEIESKTKSFTVVPPTI